MVYEWFMSGLWVQILGLGGFFLTNLSTWGFFPYKSQDLGAFWWFMGGLCARGEVAFKLGFI